VKIASPRWSTSAERATLLGLYAEADACVEGRTCACSGHGSRAALEPEETPCCHFGLIGREPHPTAVELEEVRHAMRALSLRETRSKRLPLADRRSCPLLAADGRCGIYASRPLGCRTFFCDSAEGPFGGPAKVPRAALREIGRRIADLSARFAPEDPHPRPLTRALSERKR
jgi:hypothetical protein